MEIDRLQEKIRRMKNPSVINTSILPEHIPLSIMETAGNFCGAREKFLTELLNGLKDIVPAVRFSFSMYALAGGEGLDSLQRLLQKAHSLGYYVIFDGPEALSEQEAQHAATALLGEENPWYFDGLVLPVYIGRDALKPYADRLKACGKDLFAVVRTANKTATDLQDLLTGTRLMHLANADIVNSYAPGMLGRCAYSQMAILASASSADSLRSLRGKYKDIFLLLDGCDYPNANAKNCSYAFDPLGHGAAACLGLSVVAAWQQGEGDYVELAIEAALRMKKNLLRYITIL